MPKYIYRFKETGNEIEIEQSIKDPKLMEYLNPLTGQTESVERLIAGGVGLSLGKVYKGHAKVDTPLTYKKKSQR